MPGIDQGAAPDRSPPAARLSVSSATVLIGGRVRVAIPSPPSSPVCAVDNLNQRRTRFYRSLRCHTDVSCSVKQIHMGTAGVATLCHDFEHLQLPVSSSPLF